MTYHPHLHGEYDPDLDVEVYLGSTPDAAQGDDSADLTVAPGLSPLFLRRMLVLTGIVLLIGFGLIAHIVRKDWTVTVIAFVLAPVLGFLEWPKADGADDTDNENEDC